MKTFLKISKTLLILSFLLLLVFPPAGGYRAMTDSGSLLSDAQKAEYLKTYAPKVWLAKTHPNHPEGEIYFPSPVEFSFQYDRRIPIGFPPVIKWWIYTYEELDDPSDVKDYFHGCDGDPCQLSDVPVYAFWDQVDEVDIGGELYDVVDLIYFFWFPYNRGKEVAGTVYGNHVGDWEHVSIRMIPGPDGSYVPYQIYLPAHDFGYRLLWAEIAKEETHPIVYAAWGSHGIWQEAGSHEYNHTWDLVDYCSAGTAWNTWDFVEAYDYDTEAGLLGNAWPSWMSDDYDNYELGYTDPASGPIYRWGNPEQGSCDIAYCQLANGPTGPIDKNVWDVAVLK